ncbi:hypothetical protein JDV02_008899 [Purpureocillium takamizusanense]|uniref:Acetylserotonin methytransferase-like protein n=1 Tax=Purpureocillium takamizusanense TaxID=2060973 RepID=A0A9Q8QQK7_9HYPO|nr:uncharacterized protein JDV02_008899 [Purpureocillium takamizusanense]UNI23056.1 hypothetical protein JDV02_008899 [Purpureocillium takamizusanense]
MSPQRQESFSLFPNPNSQPRVRRSESRERPQDRVATPEQRSRSRSHSRPPRPSLQITPPQNARNVPVEVDPRGADNWPLDGSRDVAVGVPRQQQQQQQQRQQRQQQRQHQHQQHQHQQHHHHHQHQQPGAADSYQGPQRPAARAAAAVPPVQQPRQLADVPARTDTSLSQANTLVRSSSVRSRSSIAKLPLRDDSSAAPAPALRSIFPTYNPEVPLGQQQYGPTQMSPSRIPRAVISRQSYYEEPQQPVDESPADAQHHHHSPRARSPASRAAAARPAPGSAWPPQRQQPTLEPPVVPDACTTEQLRSLWKATNGWKASPSEGRVFCLKLSQAKDAPVYTLSSASAQPFYSLRLDPTSASAYVTLSRHDPAKPHKDGSPGGAKNWHEALTTTLEEESRRHAPNDGLVALLMPTPAARMAVDKAGDRAAVEMAENECARLVWDGDTATHFVVHQALAKPFCVAVDRSPAYSRVEYTLEHTESPRHLAKLTRDGTGGGWIELDTGVASQIQSFYVVDVAVAALLLVASADERNSPAPIETFEPPPAPPPPAVLATERGSSRLSKAASSKKRKMQQFEMDVESQESLKGGGTKLPLAIRAVVKLGKGLFKCVVWLLTVAFKCVAGVFKLLYKCVGSKY